MSLSFCNYHLAHVSLAQTESIFHVLEPVLAKINEAPKSPQGLSSRLLQLKSNKSEWFRSYKDFFVPGEAYDIFFLRNKIAIMCGKGFEIMDLIEYVSPVTVDKSILIFLIAIAA